MTTMTDLEQRESLCHDPVHGYIPFVSKVDPGETSERALLDHPWLQRLRQIHQLQTAWWVYPAAEHTRFQHVVGSMHMASRMTEVLYPSLLDVCPDAPSRGYVECLTRLAALLHDVGHGPFGHFFDAHFLQEYGLTHEILGSHIIREELGPLLKKVRTCPGDQRLADHESIDPEQIAWLITRPVGDDSAGDTSNGRAGWSCSAACSADCTPSTTWISCSATLICRATAPAPMTWTVCSVIRFSVNMV